MYYLVMNEIEIRGTRETLDRAELAHQVTQGSDMGDIGITVLIRLHYALMLTLMNRALEPFGLIHVSYITLMSLSASPGASANPSELCRWIGETRANMTRICDELVAKGLVRRVPSPEDRRRVDLSLTEQGAALLRQAVPVVREGHARLMSCLDAQEKKTLSHLLTRLNHQLEAHL